jgi:AcrR family transcriptional regulator
MPLRAGLDRARVVQAAAALVNTEGLEALSLSRLARQLGVQTSSLYNHVEGLPGLQRELALLNTRALGDQLAGAAIGKSGREAVLAMTQAFRTYIQNNPGLYQAGLRASANRQPVDTVLGAADGRVVEICLAALTSFSLSGEDALHAVRGLRSLVHGFTTLEIAGGFGLPLDLDESFHRLVEMFILGLENKEKDLTTKFTKKT